MVVAFLALHGLLPIPAARLPVRAVNCPPFSACPGHCPSPNQKPTFCRPPIHHLPFARQSTNKPTPSPSPSPRHSSSSSQFIHFHIIFFIFFPHFLFCSQTRVGGLGTPGAVPSENDLLLKRAKCRPANCFVIALAPSLSPFTSLSERAFLNFIVLGLLLVSDRKLGKTAWDTVNV